MTENRHYLILNVFYNNPTKQPKNEKHKRILFKSLIKSMPLDKTKQTKNVNSINFPRNLSEMKQQEQPAYKILY